LKLMFIPIIMALKLVILHIAIDECADMARGL
jgi:hypothetical protein